MPLRVDAEGMGLHMPVVKESNSMQELKSNTNIVLLAISCVLGTVVYMTQFQQEPACKCDSKAISQMQADIANLQVRLNGLRNLGTPIGSPVGKPVGSPAQ